MKRVLVSLPEGIFSILRELKGRLGESDSEIVRSSFTSYRDIQFGKKSSRR